MKIIGSCGYDCYIAEVSVTELSKIRGGTSGAPPASFRVGDSIDVDKSWQLLRQVGDNLSEFQRQKTGLQSALNTLHMLFENFQKSIEAMKEAPEQQADSNG